MEMQFRDENFLYKIYSSLRILLYFFMLIVFMVLIHFSRHSESNELSHLFLRDLYLFSPDSTCEPDKNNHFQKN